MSQNSNTQRKGNESDIAQRAALLWEREGRPEGRALDHWLQAEAQIAAEGRANADTNDACGRVSDAEGGGRCASGEHAKPSRYRASRRRPGSP